jgi:hypothetical protein
LERANRVGGGDRHRRQGLRRASLRHGGRRPRRHDRAPSPKERADSPIHLAPIRQRVESIFWTCSVVRAALWSTTSPEGVESTI